MRKPAEYTCDVCGVAGQPDKKAPWLRMALKRLPRIPKDGTRYADVCPKCGKTLLDKYTKLSSER